MNTVQRIVAGAVGLVILTAAIAVVSQHVANAQAPRSSKIIGATRVVLTQDQLHPVEGVVRAFVRTGSLNPTCLTTLAESDFPLAGTTMFCAQREPLGLGKGILVSVFMPAVPPPQFLFDVTIFQEGAAGYGTPVLCDVEGC
jgi:hypothetical protein